MQGLLLAFFLFLSITEAFLYSVCVSTLVENILPGEHGICMYMCMYVCI